METLLSQAPGLGYIDGIMMTYNYRNMHAAEMKAAVAACVQAGIGLTAMKPKLPAPGSGEAAAATRARRW
jgi:trehalose-6-phosphatase